MRKILKLFSLLLCLFTLTGCKEMVNDLLISLFWFCIIPFVIWRIYKSPANKIAGKGSKSGLSHRVYNAIPSLYFDRKFVNDFITILQKESNLEGIVEKSQTEFYAWKNKNKKLKRKYRSLSLDTEDYHDLIKGNWDGDGFDQDAKRIAQSVIDSDGYKRFSEKYKFTSFDDKDMFCVIYYIITRPDFAETAKNYLYNAFSNNRNIRVPPLPKDAFNQFSRG